MMRKALIVGNPNVGKSVLFHALTSRFAEVSNYPGTTVEVTSGTAGTAAGAVEVIDTPGVNGLTPTGEDEAVTRDMVLREPDAPILLTVDAKNLRRGLALAVQLLEMERPFALVLNMLDEARARGIEVDVEALERALGVPVIPAVAIHGQGVAEARAYLASPPSQAPRPARDALPTYSDDVERALGAVRAAIAEPGRRTRGHATLLLAHDGSLGAGLDDPGFGRAAEVAAAERRRLAFGERGSATAVLATARMRVAESLVRRVVTVDRERADAPQGGFAASRGFPGRAAAVAWRLGASGAFGYLAAQIAGAAVPSAPWWAIVAGVAGAAFTGLTVAGRAVERRLAERFGRWAMHPVWGVAVLLVVLYLVYRFVGVLGAQTLVGLLEEDLFEGAVNPWLRDVFSAIPWRIVRDFFVGPYGLFTMALTYALAIILPIVSTFFVAFAILEDSGYLPRLAVMVDRLFRLMGLNGKAVLPMVLGLGCDTMATLTARILETRKERVLVTFLLALGIPCSAQLGVILAMFPRVGIGLGLVWACTIVATLLVAGRIAASVVPGDRSDFLMEIPPVRRPLLANVALKTAARLEWYLKEAVPLFVLGTFILFVLHEAGALGTIRRAGEPIVTHLLGLPREASEAFLMGFLRRDYGATMLFQMAEQGKLTDIQIVVSMVTITLFIPCVANFFMIWKERGARVAAAVVALVFPIAFLVGGAVNAVLGWVT